MYKGDRLAIAIRMKKSVYIATQLTASVDKKVERAETPVSEHTRQMLDKFYGAWEGDESAEQIIATMKENNSIREPLEF